MLAWIDLVGKKACRAETGIMLILHHGEDPDLVMHQTEDQAKEMLDMLNAELPKGNLGV